METYMDRLKEDLAKYLGLPKEAKVVSIDESCYYREGCPTCGGDYEWTVTVRWIGKDGKAKHENHTGSLADFLSDIPLGK